MISSLERLFWLLCKEKNWVRARPGMERAVSQEHGEEDPDCWWWSACSTNGVIREGKEVKSDPQFSRLGNAQQAVPATEAVSEHGTRGRTPAGAWWPSLGWVERAIGCRAAKLELPSWTLWRPVSKPAFCHKFVELGPVIPSLLSKPRTGL